MAPAAPVAPVAHMVPVSPVALVAPVARGTRSTHVASLTGSTQRLFNASEPRCFYDRVREWSLIGSLMTRAKLDSVWRRLWGGSWSMTALVHLLQRLPCQLL